MPINEIHDEELPGNPLIAQAFPASPEGVDIVLSAHVDLDAGPTDTTNMDGRSPWLWLLLSNGDVLLATFPHGDTYMEIENIRHEDYKAAAADVPETEEVTEYTYRLKLRNRGAVPSREHLARELANSLVDAGFSEQAFDIEPMADRSSAR